jgi:hypothetical protein
MAHQPTARLIIWSARSSTSASIARSAGDINMESDVYFAFMARKILAVPGLGARHAGWQCPKDITYGFL